MTSPLPVHPPRTVPDRSTPGSRGRPWVILAIVLGLACLAIPVVGFVVWAYLGPDADQPRAAAEQFLQRVEASDDSAAYRSLCASTRNKLSSAAFTAAVDRPARAASHKVTRTVFLDEAGHSAAADVEVTDRTGSVRTIELYLTELDGVWQVCGDAFK